MTRSCSRIPPTIPGEVNREKHQAHITLFKGEHGRVKMWLMSEARRWRYIKAHHGAEPAIAAQASAFGYKQRGRSVADERPRTRACFRHRCCFSAQPRAASLRGAAVAGNPRFPDFYLRTATGILKLQAHGKCTGDDTCDIEGFSTAYYVCA